MPSVTRDLADPTLSTRAIRPLLACLALCLAWASPGNAHQLRMAYLQLSESTRDTYDVLWKVPASGDDLRMDLTASLPAQCKALSEPRASIDGGAHSARWRIGCAGGLSGGRIHIAGLSRTASDALVRIESLDGSDQIARLVADRPELVIGSSPGVVQVAATYLGLGIEHILLGIDHLLFVLTLMMIVRGTRRLVATVTAFTLAHSITLAAATLGLVAIPIIPVEAIIALSIVFVAREILRMQRGHASLTASAPWLVAFAFGLLHGFGFASALGEIGLPQSRIPVALLFFNLGVEAGQLLFVAVVLLLRRGLRDVISNAPPSAARVPPYAIGGVAMFWVIERIAAF